MTTECGSGMFDDREETLSLRGQTSQLERGDVGGQPRVFFGVNRRARAEKPATRSTKDVPDWHRAPVTDATSNKNPHAIKWIRKLSASRKIE